VYKKAFEAFPTLAMQDLLKEEPFEGVRSLPCAIHAAIVYDRLVI
jgi:hypothetical protein